MTCLSRQQNIGDGIAYEEQLFSSQFGKDWSLRIGVSRNKEREEGKKEGGRKGRRKEERKGGSVAFGYRSTATQRKMIISGNTGDNGGRFTNIANLRGKADPHTGEIRLNFAEVHH
ncbi:hypothetical protein STEG23_034815 [Scotinomys teguina]